MMAMGGFLRWAYRRKRTRVGGFRSVIMAEVMHAVISHRSKGDPMTIEASILRVADALDMGADASVYALSLLAVGTAAARKKQLARASGYLQLGLALVGLVEVIRRFVVDVELPEGWEGSEIVLASAPGEATVAARTGMPAQAGSRDQAASRDQIDGRDQAGMPWGHLLPWEARGHRR